MGMSSRASTIHHKNLITALAIEYQLPDQTRLVENDRAEWSLVMISDMKQHGRVAEADLI